MQNEVAHIDYNIRHCLSKSTGCPIVEDREYWLKKMMYWQIELENHPDIIKRDAAHRLFASNLETLSENVAIRLGIVFTGTAYQHGVLYSEFVRGSFECRVHCVDVENVMGILKSSITRDEKKAEIKRILDIYSINQEQAQFSL